MTLLFGYWYYMADLFDHGVYKCYSHGEIVYWWPQKKILDNHNTEELQRLERWWLVYHGCFELVLESLGKNPIPADLR